MSRSFAFNSWAKGEIAPNMRGRIDTEMYYSSAEQMENMLVRPTGMAVRRIGTYFAQTVASPATYSRRLIPFSSSVDKSYLVELGEEYLKIRNTAGEYETLDLILEEIIKHGVGAELEHLKDKGIKTETILKVRRLYLNSEYKRRQLVQSIKVSESAFGIGRRYPVLKRLKF